MIQTEHLTLMPNGPDQLLALIERPEEYEARAGFPAAAGLREFFVSDDVSQSFLESLRTLSEPDPWRLGFAAVHRGARMVIGSGGFKGPPDSDGVVEIAYGIVPAFQRRGYATEVARALVEYALRDNTVRRLIAHTLREHNPSTKVLKKCGFEFIGEVVEPDDGPVWRWERSLASS
ncbi:MAG TPA: GNAT family N-acetyltransferase [Gemmatimonadaceae bacterium]|nr:GNAT family N-acetyltransferase [Gemmatimonadaceae bacterium]